jgi:hypothetical protein
MAVEVATAYVNIVPSMRGFGAALGNNPELNQAGKTAGGRWSQGFGGAIKSVVGPIVATIGLAKIGGFTKDLIGAASDMQESGTKLDAVFGSAVGQVQNFASAGAKALGQSKLDLLNSAAQFGVFGKAAKLQGPALAQFSTSLAGLSTDLASFYNTNPADAAAAIAAGLRGESEPLRQYGILLDDATLRQKALKLGLIATTKDALTPQQKVLAAQAVIMEQSAIAQGDFAKTSGGLANQQRILAAQWDDMKGRLGAGLLPTAVGFVSMLNTSLIPALESVGKKSKAAWSVLASGDFKGGLGFEEDSPFIDFLFKLREFGIATFKQLGGVWDSLKDTAKALWPPIKSLMGTIGEVFKSLSGAGLSAWGLFLDALKAIADIAKAVLVPALTWLAKFFKDNPAQLYILIGAFTAWKVAAIGIAAATKAWAVVQGILNAVLNMSPIMRIVTALTLLAGGLVYAWQHSEKFRDIVKAVWDVIQNVVSFAWNNVIRPVFEGIKTGITAVIDFFSNFGTHLSNFGSWVAEIFGKVIDWFAALPGRIWDAITAIPGKLVELGAWLLTRLGDGIHATMHLIVDFFTALPGAIWNLVTTLPGKLLDLGMWIIKKIVTGIGDIAAGFWDFLGWIGGLIYKGLSGLITLGAQVIGWIVIGLAQGVWDIIGWLGEMVSKAWNGIKDIGRRIGAAIAEGVKSALSGIGDSFEELGKGNVTKSIYGGYVPKLASGGYAAPTPGGSLAIIGEGRHGEWVLPDPLLKQVIATSASSGGGKRQIGEHITINAGVTVDEVRAAMNESLRRVPMHT